MDGNCIQTVNYPLDYGNYQECEVQVFGTVPVLVEHFETEACCDKLTVGSFQYGGSGVSFELVSRDMHWKSDYSETAAGWRICSQLGSVTPPAPTPAPAPGWTISSGSGCVMDGNCIQTANYPSEYGNDQGCDIQVTGVLPVVVEAFETEACCDSLEVGGTVYRGSDANFTQVSGDMIWVSDYSKPSRGWKICARE